MTTPMNARAVAEKCAEICDDIRRAIRRGPPNDWPSALDIVEECRDEIREYAATLPAEAKVPDGWKLVPVEPTECMMKEGANRIALAAKQSHYMVVASIYKAMLAAAPTGNEEGK